ncbi:polysaccharide pyruvyl transferase [Actinomadura sp. NBRC 104412]|uniref:polysaccharide pyruvyl transferase family protein n=1 Tax=Actinomadura sp. NBRC 104412 TaxID=3032203 RepID=UPI0024A31153|nr:polysaccharide pyruvyl transferase family protein [Actinomadura sp. NBRC 104412]GLZ07903.1 polysaccharide pyruvyl transferase [Actinomadura sp. NBRC 104412]
MRVLLTGWPSFVHGEATAGDVLAMEAVYRTLRASGAECDVAWSPVLRPDGLTLEQAEPAGYTHLVFACGPVHGEQVRYLHERYARCRRIAVGVSVVDRDEPAARGFDVILPRDAPGRPPRRDLAAYVPSASLPPVVGVVLSPGQGEYGSRGRHDRIEQELAGWLKTRECARVPLDTRLDARDWRHATGPMELEAVLRRLDLVVTTRLHGLVLALKNGLPALAVDPIGGGAKVTAQARAWDWPAIVTTGRDDAPPYLDRAALNRWWDWCLSSEGRNAPSGRAPREPSLLEELARALDRRR